MKSQIIPTYVFAEMTPNPATMKFVADRAVIEPGKVAEYNSFEEADQDPGLPGKLFNFPFVDGVFVTSNFITVAKTPNVEWDMISMELREFISKYLMENEYATTAASDPTPQADDSKSPLVEQVLPETDAEKQIVHLLDEFVRPAVEGDGGRIDFKSFKEGRVTVTLRGACSGCPSSTQTLKGGIENLLKSKMPEVLEVVAEEL